MTPTHQYLAEVEAHIREHQWGRAQQVMERVEREGRSGEVRQLLAEVRAVRRCLRQLNKWSRDPNLHLELGRLYFGLELGDEALAALSHAVELQPNLAEGHYFLALEYLFRGDAEAACHCCERAHALKPALPTFDRLQRLYAEAEREGEGLGTPTCA